MKTQNIFPLLVALLTGAACSEDHPQEEAKKQQVTFTIGEVGNLGQSRTVTHDNGTTDFVAGDCIGIFATKGADGVNVRHVVGADGTLASDEGVYYNGSGDATANFYAYYPYDAAATGSSVNFRVASNQDDEQRFNQSDFMTASSLDVPVDSQGEIVLKFQHRLSLIRLEMVLAHNISLPDSVLVCNCRTALTWDYQQGSCTTTGEPTPIRMWQRSIEGNPVFMALVPAQQLAAKTKLISIHIGSKTYAFTTSDAVSLSGNAIKKFKIGIGSDDKLVVFSADISGGTWEEDGQEISGEGTLVEGETLLPLTDFEQFSYSEVAKTKEEITAAGWWRFLAYPQRDVVEIAADPADTSRGQVMHFRRDTIPWHNGTFYYCTDKAMKGRYRLTFKAKSAEAANMKANQLRIGAYMQESYLDETGKEKYRDYFAIIERNNTEVTTVYSQVLTYDSYQEYSIDFNLGKVSTEHTGTASKVTEESKSVPTDDLLQKVVLYISCNKIDIDFWIDDMRWEPIE